MEHPPWPSRLSRIVICWIHALPRMQGSKTLRQGDVALLGYVHIITYYIHNTYIYIYTDIT